MEEFFLSGGTKVSFPFPVKSIRRQEPGHSGFLKPDLAHCGIGVKSAPLFFLMFPGNFLVVRIVILEGPVKEFSKKNHARHRAGQKPIKNFTLLNN